ncbi:cell division protein FtsA [Pelosinus sp. UFO1]|uniref:cell division protein FtsA n=1 Tax=Pelosinus sp. UFO1 TaxID=484770 RepID=UPI0004D12249|nr:cell division protein FtsA [Pelosinus sp. UFO1]AIF52055.1 cell division protein FtsA [Pelosinus sp. UFO1]
MDGRYILGIDIGTSTIKVFIGTLDTNGNVLVAGSGTAPTVGFKKGIFSDPKLLAMTIKQAVDCAVGATDICVKDAYIGISGIEIKAVNSLGSVSPLLTDQITQDDISRGKRAATFVAVTEDHEVLHVLPQKFFVDKQRVELPLQENGSHLEVQAHIVSIPKKILNSLVNAIEELGINVVNVVVNSIVVTENIKSTSSGNFLLMDIGAGTTELTLYQEGYVFLSASLPLGGDYITSDIMQGISISWNHAEEIKKYYAKLDKQLRGQEITLDCNAYNTTDKHIPYDFLNDIVESRVSEIIYLLSDYLKLSLEEIQIGKVFLTGGCGAMPSFIECIGTTFGVPVEIIHPSDLPPEYSSPGNTACYSIVKYAVKNLSKPQVAPGSNAWQRLMNRCNKFFKN